MEKSSKNQSWVSDLVDAAQDVVWGYEEYLMDEIDSKKLAKIMTRLRNLLPENTEK